MWRKRRCFTNPVGNYMFKSNNRNTRTRSEICSKLTINTPERRHRRRSSGVFIVIFEYLSHLILVFLLLTLNMQLPAGYIHQLPITNYMSSWKRNYVVYISHSFYLVLIEGNMIIYSGNILSHIFEPITKRVSRR